MKRVIYALAVLFLLAGFSNNTYAQKDKKMASLILKTFDDSVAYAYGFLIGNQMKELKVNKEILKNGIDDQFAGTTKITEEEAQMLMKRAQQVRQRSQKKEAEEQAKKNIAVGKNFLNENKTKDGVGSTPSGLQYQILTAGTGSKPLVTDKVIVHYEGKLLDGTIFDSSVKRGTPSTFGLNQVIKGWTEGLQLMNTGAKYRFFIPSDLAYGSRGQRNIPPHSVLIFEVELIEIAKQ